jgi:hypothetical protein
MAISCGVINQEEWGKVGLGRRERKRELIKSWWDTPNVSSSLVFSSLFYSLQFIAELSKIYKPRPQWTREVFNKHPKSSQMKYFIEI